MRLENKFWPGLLSGIVIGGIVGNLGAVRYCELVYGKKLENERPTQVRSYDLNDDGIKDIIVDTAEKPLIFLGQTNGTYLPFREYQRNVSNDLVRAVREKEAEDLSNFSLYQLRAKPGEKVRPFEDTR